MDETTCVAEPITLSVPLGNLKETDLMAALEFVVEHWRYNVHCSIDPDATAEIVRSVSWLREKFAWLPQPQGMARCE